MDNGLYSLIFGTPGGSLGAGVAVFNNDRVLGGDLTYFYEGSLRRSAGDAIDADVMVRRYQATGESVFGNLSEFRLRLSGNATGSSFVLSGSIANQPASKITVQCSKLASL